MQEYFAKEVGTGLAGGALSGGVFGFGRGLMEDENPFKTAAQDAAIGLALGGATGYGAGKIGKQFAKRNLYNNAGNEQIANKYYDNYIDGLNDYQNDWREFNRLKLGDNYGGSGQLFNNSDDFVDLTNAFQEKPTLEDAKNFVNAANANGTVFETASPDYYIDMYGNSKKRHHIVRSSKFGQMSQDERNRHNVYINSFDKISPNLRPKGKPAPNTKIDKKPNIDKYHYFETNIKNGDDLYPITVSTEQYIGEPDVTPQTVHLYDLLENKKSLPTHNGLPSVTAGSDTNIIPDTAAKINPEPLSNIPTNNTGYSVKLRRIQRPSFNMEQALKNGYYPVNSVEQTLPLNTEEGKALKELLNKNWELKQNYKVDYIDPHSGYWNKRTGKMDLGYPRYFDTKEEAEKFAQTVQEPLINLVKEWHHYYGGGKDYLLNIQKLKDAGFNIDTSTANKVFHLKSLLGGIGLAELLKRQSALYDGLTQQ